MPGFAVPTPSWEAEEDCILVGYTGFAEGIISLEPALTWLTFVDNSVARVDTDLRLLVTAQYPSEITTVLGLEFEILAGQKIWCAFKGSGLICVYIRPQTQLIEA